MNAVVAFIRCFAPYAELLRHKIASQKVGQRFRGQMYRAISMICSVRPTFMNSTPGLTQYLNYQNMSSYQIVKYLDKPCLVLVKFL